MSYLRILATTLVLAGSAQLPPPVHAEVPQPVVVPLMQKDLADLPGREMLMLAVEYPPGTVEHIHRHDAHAFVYVLEGSIVMQVDGGKAVTLGPGQTFYESPDDVHVVSKNASDSQPAKFLVFFVKDKGAASLVPVK